MNRTKHTQRRPHQARRAASQLIRRMAHGSKYPLTQLEPNAAMRVAKWALDADFVDEVMNTGAPAPTIPDCAEQLRSILPAGEAWAEAILKMPDRHIAYHLDNYKGTLRRLERGDANETYA
ncbi:Purple acid phosphatase 22 [Durusdinium trenchii]|uniref:Purple acid phosphatase 22 n=1 Tax=Durusdinium trenchii TaxID=1381693 RepID=A0ABP0R294_9DINO